MDTSLDLEVHLYMHGEVFEILLEMSVKTNEIVFIVIIMITVRVHAKRLYFILKWTGNISLVGFKLATKEYSAGIIIFYKLYYIRYVITRRGDGAREVCIGI